MSDVEEIKLHSDHLRGGILASLEDPTQDGFTEDDRNLIKFHGLYQQKSREKGIPEDQKRATFLIRGRIPGGLLSAAQYLAWDDLATRFGGGSLRITTRQTFQLHGVVKDDLRPLMKAIHDINLTTQGSCGDVVRNVSQAVNTLGSPELALLDEPARRISDHFLAKTSAWTEIWLGETRLAAPGDEKEPFYGDTYLPRKFKIGVTIAGDNGIDLLTNDLGFAATIVDGRIEGWFVYAGGGMGMNHNKAETYPRVADLVGWIPDASLIATAEALIGAYRDLGDRTNRKHARLKYVVEEMGLAAFRAEVESRLGFAFAHREPPAWTIPDLLGWHRRHDGTWALGVHVLAGRLRDGEQGRIRTAVRAIVERFGVGVQLTADQDIALLGLTESDKKEAEGILDASGFEWRPRNRLHVRALGCVSLPTCGLALAEAERALPAILGSLEETLAARGLLERAPVVRVTGCPNGCARPFSAEIGFAGMAPDRYAIFLGGSPVGTRVARLWAQKIPSAKLAETLDPVFALWARDGRPDEAFGDFVARVGVEALPAA